MATSIIKPAHGGIDVAFTIAASSWSSETPSTYTWTDSRVTAGCRIEVHFADSNANTTTPYISYEKASGGGGIVFTASTKPTEAMSVVVALINAQTGNVTSPAAVDVLTSNTGISPGANVNEALTTLAKHIISDSTSITITSTHYTTQADGYFNVRCSNATGQYEYGFIVATDDNVLIISAVSGVSAVMQGYPVNTIFIRKGTEIYASGNGTAKFYPLS